MTANNSYHTPVMLEESLEGLAINPEGTYVDLTFGGGGHSRAILDKLAGGHLIAFDQDQDATTQATKITDQRFKFIHANFRFLGHFLAEIGIQQVCGILVDLGVSSHQINEGKRGFSTRLNGPLDMRMNTALVVDASKIIHTYSMEQLTTLFRMYGELPHAQRLAQLIVRTRRITPIHTTQDLINTISPSAPRYAQAKYYAQVFQALRITVNDELGALEEVLKQIPALLKPNGRLVTLAYHSLEDRLIKYFMRTGNCQGKVVTDLYGNLIRPLIPIKRKADQASPQEVAHNSRARSARLRIASKPAQ